MRERGLFCVCMIMTILLYGCSGFQSRSTFEEANALFSQGNYNASLDKYGEIIEKDPSAGDRALFEMGIIHAYPKNGLKDYQKALDCFQKLVEEYPGSGYRQDSERMIIYLGHAAAKDATIAAQQQQLDALRHDLDGKQSEIVTLHTRIKALEQKVFTFATQKGPIDRILIEKKERRLTLLSKGEVLKSYRIALGGNPIGPKERQGDNKTPEGTYVIAARNKDSRYHLSLHISYPNEKDKKRARELGVSPGGNIMIHGIKNGLSWVGDGHTEVDWTQGCIAVTDEEIEEIAKVARNGTLVEIRP
ncbi:L,D-transpeptidase family protein [Pelotalea chapellei]|uniref:L,D-transpeptidase family protein n=1 Tax=Pelotalea chapellei TaxID=44671 RepID=A0ABS5UCX7_9BACT|nr:L,D-transpeptidase family protein [Pelotalea chapellei]MBT1073522.1 L,D-transpeptidase family protein [Pelotalea chapellei]